MKYIVWVNQKFLVKVEAESYGGAEHKILDNYDGICAAQAFSIEDTRTDYFASVLETAEMISLDELKVLTKCYKEACYMQGDTYDAVVERRKEIEELESQMKLAKENLRIAEKNYDAAVDTVTAQKKIINLKS